MKEKERRERKTGIGSLRPINISLVTVIPTSGFSVTALLHTYSLPTRPILGLPSRSLQVHLRDLRRKYNGRYHLYLPLASFLFYRPAKRFGQLVSFPFQSTTTSVPNSSYCQPHAILFTVAAVPGSSFEPFFLIQVQIAQRTRPLLEGLQPFFTHDAPAAPRYVRYVAFEVRTTYSRLQLLDQEIPYRIIAQGKQSIATGCLSKFPPLEPWRLNDSIFNIEHRFSLGFPARHDKVTARQSFSMPICCDGINFSNLDQNA